MTLLLKAIGSKSTGATPGQFVFCLCCFTQFISVNEGSGDENRHEGFYRKNGGRAQSSSLGSNN